MNLNQDFDHFYKTVLIKPIKELEEIRKKILRFNLFVTLLVFVFFGLSLFLITTGLFQNETKFLLFFGLLIIFLIIVIPKANKISNYKFDIRYKQEVIQKIVHFISPDFTYRPNASIRRSDFERSKIFLNKIDKFSGDDYVEGTVGKTKFGFSEIHTQTVTSNGKSTTVETFFQGLFFVVDFNKDFSGTTVLIPRSLGVKWRFFNRISGMSRKQKFVELEDPEFNNLFNCFSDNDIKARYILSHSLMQRIVSFRKTYPKHPLYFSFVDGVMFMAVNHNKPLFEAKISTSLLNPHIVKSYYQDIKLVYDLVHILHLNTRIWSKD
jgi:hypothetical protein